MGSLGGSPSGVHLDPERVFALVINRRAQDLFDYLDSVHGASEDLRCHLVSFAGRALLAPRLGNWWPDSYSWTLYWAKYAWAHAVCSRLCAPPVAGNLSNFTSDPVPRNAAMLIELSASSSRTPAATFSVQLANHYDVINFPIIRARALNRTSSFNSGTHASDFAPWGTDSTLEMAFANMSLGQPGSEQMAPWELMQNTVSPYELEQNNHGTPAMRLSSLHQPGSAQLTPQRLLLQGEVLPAVDIKGKGPASEVVQQELQVHVACLMADDGTTGAAGLLIKKGTWQFVCALCFPMRSSETVLFAAACCEGIKVAQAYQPISILLESHLFHLIDLLFGAHAACPDMEELAALLDLSHCRAQHITEECNGAARRLAMHCLQTGAPDIFFSAPDWLVLT